MRIISGENRGRKLTQIKGWDIRPTSDRAREAIFNIIGPSIRDCRVLDLFAGTGALGLEALSRGACEAVFVEMAKASCDAVKENIQRCNQADRALLLNQDATLLAFAPSQAPFDLVFLDPPYDKGLVDQVLNHDQFLSLVTDDAMVVVEQSTKEPPLQIPKGLDIYRQKKYSKTRVTFLTRSDV